MLYLQISVSVHLKIDFFKSLDLIFKSIYILFRIQCETELEGLLKEVKLKFKKEK